jgi:hypothetical protein
VARAAIHLNEHIVSCLGLGHQLGELCGGSDQITSKYLCHSEAVAALARPERVADRLGEIASFFGERAPRDRVTGGDRCDRLGGEDLAEPPLIVQLPGQADRLSEVRPGHLRVVALSDNAAGGQRPDQHGRVIDLAMAVAQLNRANTGHIMS